VSSQKVKKRRTMLVSLYFDT